MITWEIIVALVLLSVSMVMGGWAALRLLLEVSNSFKWYDDRGDE